MKLRPQGNGLSFNFLLLGNVKTVREHKMGAKHHRAASPDSRLLTLVGTPQFLNLWAANAAKLRAPL